MISYWKQQKQLCVDDGLVLIYGWYDHKNEEGGGNKALGVHWGDYPLSRGVLSPCVIPASTRNAILAGLLHQAVMKGDQGQRDAILQALDFFKEPEILP